QRLSIWRNNFGSTAIAIVAHFLSVADERRSPQEICDDLLTGLTFLFRDLDPKPENAFRSPLVLQLLAHTHLRPCVGCPNIPRLNTTALKAHGIKGAISLCCAALERALRLIQRGDIDIGDQTSARSKATVKMPFKFNKAIGKESSTALLFSEQNWGSCTREYLMSINKRDVATLKEIVSMASALKTSALDGILSEDGSYQDNAMANDQMVAANQHKNICRNCAIFLGWLLIY
ncbi:hypothetical protein SCLCIDRAFT_143617, partial [Scleroderma citrinum Foug A]